MRRRRIVAVAVLAALAAGCGSPPPSAAPPVSSEPGTPAAAGLDGEWRLLAGRGPLGRVPIPRQVTLVIAGDRVSGVAACNQYDGRAHIQGETFAARDLMRTEMGCMERRRTLAEERYLDALAKATTIRRDGDRLRVTGPRVALRFERVPPPEPAAFEDTVWKLESLAYGTDASSTVSSTQAPAQLRFGADGSLTGSTGCRDIAARWERTGDTITVTGLPQGEVDCSVAGEQNDHVMQVLREPFTATLESRSLWLQQAEGDLGLDLRAD